jgi:alpha-D-xyloside xylohydrolase
MKTFKKLTLFFTGIVLSCSLYSQTDKTGLITNPSFELGNLTGWTWTGTAGYAWLGPNTDGDATKDGSYICGIWNSSIGDAECSRSLTGLTNGYYKVTALATVSTNRTTTQRLFANNKSTLYGASSNPAYSAANLAILGATETYSFGGYAESAAENGPFKRLSVVVHVTDGNLTFGFRVNGKGTTKGYDFSYSPKGDAGFFKFDNFTLTEVSNVATLDGITFSAGALDTAFVPGKTNYTASLPVGTTSVTPNAIVSVEGETVSGNGAVDVSGGSGTSTITVTSPDGNTSKVYTIIYKVMGQSYKTLIDGVQFFVPGGSMKVKVCTDKIIQVSYSTADTIPAKDSIIVNKIWGTPDFSVSETADSVKITTSSLIVKVSKSTFLVSYYDHSGNLLLSENQKSMTPVTVLTTKTNTCSAIFNSPSSEGLYGLGQHQQKIMNYKGNSLALDQQNGEIALPFMLSTQGYGLLWDNYSLTNFYGNLSSNTQYQFTSESGKMVDYYFMYGPEPDSIISDYRIASGKAQLFPKWAYGLFQSKDKYSTSDELLSIAGQYRKAGIALDCIVQDWDYWTPDYWGSHTMDATKYPDPKALIDSLHAMNVHSMISIWPVFHSSTANYTEFNAINAVYPSNGPHHFYDPHNDAARKIYWNQVKSQLFGKYGWDAWWADNDEPQGYPDAFDRKNFITARGSGVTYYNTYPIEHTAGVYNGWRADIPNKRLFTLSRSAFPGQQRYAAASWSGDISSNWASFQNQLSAGLNFCLSGIPYWTTDIGGYFGADWTTPANQELMIRWFQYGTFCPLFRVHGKGDKALVSTGSFTQNTIDHLVTYNKLRYRLMPYIYSLAWKVTNENYTIMRHLIMDYRTDANVKNIDNQFLFGPFMMINPVTTAGASNRSVYLPAGKWFDFWTGGQLTGGQTINADAPLDKMPIFVKAGSIIPMGPEITYATQSADPLEIRVYKGDDGKFVLYEDDGTTYNYERDQYSEIPFTYNDGAKQLVIGIQKGSFINSLPNRTFKVVLVDSNYGTGLNNPLTFDSIVHYTGNEVIVNLNGSKTAPQSHYEAENATLSGTAQVASAQTGYSGTGYVDGLNLSRTGKITFNVTVPEAGLYSLKMRYSAGSGSTRKNLKLSVNDNQTYDLKCENTKDFTTWGFISSIARLNSGSNTITYSGDSAFVALDYLDITTPSEQPYFLGQSRVCRIRQLNGTKYIGVNGNNILVGTKDTTSRDQLWKIEKINNSAFTLTSVVNGKCMTVNGASLLANAKVITSTYNNQADQQWSISDFGSNVYKLTSLNSNLCLSTGAADTLTQNTDNYLPDQRWVLEDTTLATLTSVYEPFDYLEGSNLNGSGVAGKGWGSAWTVYEGTSTDMTIKAPTAYSGLVTTGNKLTGKLSSATALRASRNLSSKWADDGSSFWISFLLEINNPSAIADSWQGLSLFNGSAERILIGKNWGKSQLGIVGYDASEGTSTISALNLQQTWIVVLIKTSGDANNENAYLWVNPDPKTEPLIANANISTTVQLNNGFDRIVCHLGNTAGILASYDEIRIGKAYVDVNSTPAAAGKIIGKSSVCKGSSKVIYKVPQIVGATSYVWSLPSGATGTSIADSILVNYTDTAVSGNIKVKGHNQAGDGAVSSLAVTVNAVPSTPVITLNNGVLQSSATTGNLWYLNDTIISGAVNPTWQPVTSGKYHTVTTLNGCLSQSSNIISYNPTGINQTGHMEAAMVYPNPTTGIVKVSVKNKIQSDYTIEVYNNTGRLLQAVKKNKTETEFILDWNKFPAGLYFVHIFNSTVSFQTTVTKE